MSSARTRRTPPPADTSTTPATARWTGRDWVAAAMIALAVLVAYGPCLRGTPVWDDGGHMTNPAVESLAGLWSIWRTPGATQQYYPLVHSAFWIENRLWGASPLGHHLVTLGFHAAAAILVAAFLKRLGIAGAWLAAGIFALHPVNVETAAWISELKNTLSATCTLAAAWNFIEFDERRDRWSYTAATVLFLLALAAKTVAATLPAALLVVAWWRRGRIDMRRDVMPLVPWFVLAVGAAVITVWMENTFIGASAAEYPYSFLERCLIAGRAVWFYLGRLAWPVHLSFIYPRWRIDAADPAQFIPPIGVLVGLVMLWRMRSWSRAPLAAALLFVGTLFPAIGFINVFPFRYSFVADHFVYHACIAPIALVASSIARATRRQAGAAVAWRAGQIALLVALATVSHREARRFADVETLWKATLATNEACWLAHNNLAVVFWDRGAVNEALPHVRRALELKPDYHEAYVNLGNCLFEEGDHDQAFAAYAKAMAIEPRYALASNNLGKAMVRLGRTDDARRCFEHALLLDSRLVDAACSLAAMELAAGNTARALALADQALASNPRSDIARGVKADALMGAGRIDEAIGLYRTIIASGSPPAAVWKSVGKSLLSKGQDADAIEALEQAVAATPQDAEAQFLLGTALLARGDAVRGLERLRKAVALSPTNGSAINQLAWVLSTWPDRAIRDGEAAVGLAEQAVAIGGASEAAYLDTLAAAQAECGRFALAAETARNAAAVARQTGQVALADAIDARLAGYDAGTPHREGVPAASRAE